MLLYKRDRFGVFGNLTAVGLLLAAIFMMNGWM